MKNIFKSATLLLILLVNTNLSWSENLEDFEKHSMVKDGDTLNYRILYPEKYNPDEKYPLVLFLHGAGERGNDNQKQLNLGAALFLEKKARRKYPAIVVFPQCPEGIMWTNRKKKQNKEGIWEFSFPLGNSAPRPAQMVNDLVDELLASGRVNPEKVYIMGLSMGGIATLDFLVRWPEKYKSAICICGGHNPELFTSNCNTPVWFFHGAKDNVVPPVYSQQVYQTIKSCNPKTKYTLYPKANHNSWDAAFSEQKLLKWLFANK